MKNILAIIISLLLFTSVSAKVKTDSALIEAGKVHEVCMALDFGKRLHYSFMSSRAMNFNIHYHEGENVIFPVKEHLTAEDDAIFTAGSDQGYCMMWTNPHDRAVKVNLIYNVR